jgi:hypothetical protein
MCAIMKSRWSKTGTRKHIIGLAQVWPELLVYKTQSEGWSGMAM